MINNYVIKRNNNSVEMTKPNSTMLLYKIPYKDIAARKIGFIIPNNFIVYILFGQNPKGRDRIYVGNLKTGSPTVRHHMPINMITGQPAMS